MWKVCRKTIFPRWHARRQNTSEANDLKFGLVRPTEFRATAEDGRKSGKDQRKQHTHKQEHAFWEDPQYCYMLNPAWIETIGLIGTAFVVGLNVQHRHLRRFCYSDGTNGPLYECNGQRACKKICTDVTTLFSKFAFAMPKAIPNYALPEKTSRSKSVAKETGPLQKETLPDKKVESVDASIKEMRQITNDYIAEMDHSLGLKLLNTNSHEAFKLFSSSAQLGHTKALFNLGLCYETGKGTKVDLKKAADCYIQAALKGHQYALYNLGVYHIKGIGGMPKNEKVGLQFFKRAAGQGVPEAQVYLGLQYLEEENWFDAFHMFSDAVKQDSIEGKYYLGMCYENGWGVSQNEKVAIEMYISAAFKGHEDATFSLGQYYENGRGGVTKNNQLALALYQIVADKGHLEATNAMSILKNKCNTSLIPPSVEELSSNRCFGEKRTSSSKSGLHESASSPELRNYSSFILPELSKHELSPHLDIVPFSPVGKTCSYNKLVLCSSNLSQSVFPTLSLMNWNSASTICASRT